MVIFIKICSYFALSSKEVLFFYQKLKMTFSHETKTFGELIFFGGWLDFSINDFVTLCPPIKAEMTNYGTALYTLLSLTTPPTNVIRDELQTYFFFEIFFYVGANSRVWALSDNFTQYQICVIPVTLIKLYIYLIFETPQPTTNKIFKSLEPKRIA